MRWRAGRIAAAAVAVACVLSVASCSSDDDGGGGGSAASSGTKASGDAIKVGLFNPSKGAARRPA